jgi:hypothetical protein
MARSPEGDGGGAGAQRNINGSSGWRGARILGASAERGVAGELLCSPASCSSGGYGSVPPELFVVSEVQTATILLLKLWFNQRRKNLEV